MLAPSQRRTAWVIAEAFVGSTACNLRDEHTSKPSTSGGKHRGGR